MGPPSQSARPSASCPRHSPLRSYPNVRSTRVRVTVNEPVPVRPVAELRLSQLDDSEADHLQVDPVVTVIVDEPDLEGTVSAVGLIV